MPNRVLNVSSPFSLQLGSRERLHFVNQKVVNYAESRFRRILLEIAKAAEMKKKWMQWVLKEELDVVMCFVGTATAVGQVLDVPILVRSLADSLTHVREIKLPLEFHPRLLSVLDAGLPQGSPYALVDSYLFEWWKGKKMPSAKAMMTIETMLDALQYHEETHGAAPFFLHPSPPENAPAPGASDMPEPTCANCVKYRNLATDLLGQVKELFNLSHIAETNARMKMECDMRRASALFTLHEDVVAKEGNVTMPGITAGIGPDEAEPSRKWTWGVDLTEAEVESIAVKSQKRTSVHSGYRHPLPDATNSRMTDQSPTPSNPQSQGQVSSVAPEAQVKPPSIGGRHKYAAKSSGAGPDQTKAVGDAHEVSRDMAVTKWTGLLSSRGSSPEPMFREIEDEDNSPAPFVHKNAAVVEDTSDDTDNQQILESHGVVLDGIPGLDSTIDLDWLSDSEDEVEIVQHLLQRPLQTAMPEVSAMPAAPDHVDLAACTDWLEDDTDEAIQYLGTTHRQARTATEVAEALDTILDEEEDGDISGDSEVASVTSGPTTAIPMLTPNERTKHGSNDETGPGGSRYRAQGSRPLPILWFGERIDRDALFLGFPSQVVDELNRRGAPPVEQQRPASRPVQAMDNIIDAVLGGSSDSDVDGASDGDSSAAPSTFPQKIHTEHIEVSGHMALDALLLEESSEEDGSDEEEHSETAPTHSVDYTAPISAGSKVNANTSVHIGGAEATGRFDNSDSLSLSVGAGHNLLPSALVGGLTKPRRWTEEDFAFLDESYVEEEDDDDVESGSEEGELEEE